jgi:hypothetical protein
MRLWITALGALGTAGSVAAGLFIVGQKSLEPKVENAKIESLAEAVAESNAVRAEASSERVSRVANAQVIQSNVTEEIAKKIASEITAKNPDGPSLLEGKQAISAIDPLALTDAILEEQLSKFNYQDFKPTASQAGLKLVPSTPKALTEYFVSLKGTLGKHAYTLSGANVATANFVALEAAAGNLAEALRTLPIPAPLAPLHAEEVSLVTAQANIFSALARSEEDPFRALLALQALPLVDADFKTLTTTFTTFIEEQQVSI